MQVDQWKDKTFKILNKIKEDSKALWVVCFLYLSVWSDFWCGEIDLFITNSAYELLFADFIRFWPIFIFTIHNTTFQNNSLHFINNSLCDKNYHLSTKIIPCFLISWSDLYSELLWYFNFPVESNSKSRNSWP